MTSRDKIDKVYRPEGAEDISRIIREINLLASTMYGNTHPIPHFHLLLEEAVMNAWKHGNKKQAGEEIHITLVSLGSLIKLEVIDQGDGFDYNTLTDPTSQKNILEHTGRGLFIIRTYADSVRWLANGNHIQIFVRRGA